MTAAGVLLVAGCPSSGGRQSPESTRLVIDDGLHVDGGVVATLDVETAVDRGACDTIAVDLPRCLDGRRPATLVALLTHTLDVVQRQRVDHDVVALTRARITLLQLSPGGGFGLSDFSSIDRLLEEGERLGEAALARCMNPDGTLKPGVIHDPLHLHEWPAPDPRT